MVRLFEQSRRENLLPPPDRHGMAGSCGWLDENLTLSDRTFCCEQCGLVLDRDLNAALNLEELGGSLSDRVNACGVVSAGTGRTLRVKLPTVKQEPNAL
jgi:putative transposase